MRDALCTPQLGAEFVKVGFLTDSQQSGGGVDVLRRKSPESRKYSEIDVRFCGLFAIVEESLWLVPGLPSLFQNFAEPGAARSQSHPQTGRTIENSADATGRGPANRRMADQPKQGIKQKWWRSSRKCFCPFGRAHTGMRGAATSFFIFFLKSSRHQGTVVVIVVCC